MTSLLPFLRLLLEWAIDNNRSEALLALPDTLLTEIVVLHPIAMIEEEAPFQFVLLAESWHTITPL